MSQYSRNNPDEPIQHDWFAGGTRVAKYSVIPFVHGRSFHVVENETCLPVYDNEPYGNDKPLIWHDEDKAQAYCDRLNNAEDDDSPQGE